MDFICKRTRLAFELDGESYDTGEITLGDQGDPSRFAM